MAERKVNPWTFFAVAFFAVAAVLLSYAMFGEYVDTKTQRAERILAEQRWADAVIESISIGTYDEDMERIELCVCDSSATVHMATGQTYYIVINQEKPK